MDTHPLDKVQAGYLLLKLKESDVVTKDEVRKALALLFPDLLPTA